jgi:hypothetical protein
MSTRAFTLLLIVVFTHGLAHEAHAGSWVVIHPDLHIGPPGVRALWHALWRSNTWVVVAAYDSAKPCAERASRDIREGSLPLDQFRASRLQPSKWTDLELYTLQSVLMQARCMPTDVAEKVGTLRISDMVR